MPVTYERVMVTPRLAKKWLASNAENNRNPKEARIPGYARDMQSGRWDSDSGETIKFHDNTLIDGQNRLHAVVLADVPIEFDIARTTSDRAMLVVDSGASRTAGDSLKIHHAIDRNKISSVVRWAIMWDAGLPMGKGGQFSPTHLEIGERYVAERDRFDSATKRGADCLHQKIGNSSAAGVAYYLFAKIELEQTHQFYDQLISGANLPERSPVLTLRNRMMRLRVDRITRAEQLALYIRAWNAFRKGEMPASFIIAKGDLTNLNFPQPK